MAGAKKGPTVRIQIDLTRPERERVRRVQKETDGATLNETFLKALATYQECLRNPGIELSFRPDGSAIVNVLKPASRTR